jgi:Omp85 superfamily domain
LPADQVPARDLGRLLWELLDTGHFRQAKPQRVLDFDRDLGYAPGDEPYAIPYQIQALQVLIAPLGYTLTTQASTRSGTSQYVDLSVQKAAKSTRYIGAGFAYKPGQGLSIVGIGQLPPTSLSGGGPSGNLGSGSYSAQYESLSASMSAAATIDRNRYLDGVRIDEQSTGEVATLQWEPWRSLDGNTVLFQLSPSHAVVLNRTLNSIQPGVQFVHNDLSSEYPSRTFLDPRVLIGLGFANCIVTANTHRSFDHWEYDVSGRFENAVGNVPIFELPSLGGADTVRGFRADDAIGRRLWSAQTELWHGFPRWPLLKIATFVDVGGAYQTTGSYPGLREGLGSGLRLDLRVAVLKFDWAYGFGQAATGGSRGKFYFSVVLNTPH